jgi:hypothetical protein
MADWETKEEEEGDAGESDGVISITWAGPRHVAASSRSRCLPWPDAHSPAAGHHFPQLRMMWWRTNHTNPLIL